MSNATIRTAWTPHPGQREVMESPARFRIVACGRRWGKTEFAARESSRYLGTPDTDVWWVAPTYDIADVGFDTALDALPTEAIADVKRTKPKGITLVNGSEISFRSADREDSLRAVGLDLLVIDEAAMVPERAWTEELRPTLSDTLGDMIAISTPKGRGWFYRWFQRGRSEDYPETASWQSPTYDNPHVPDSEIDDAANEVPERVFEQEYLAEFKDESGGVFEGLDRNLFTDRWTLPEDGLPPLRDGTQVRPETVYAVPPFSTGVDLARHQDWRVILTLDRLGRLAYFDREQGEAWSQIQREVQDVYDRYPGIVSVDASRDNKLVADLEQSGVDLRPVKFSASRKQNLIENLVARVEAGELAAPEVDILRTELEVFEFDVTRAGNVRYEAPEGFHDDTVDALALAADGLDVVARQAVSTTASVGREERDPRGGQGIVDVAKDISRRRQKAQKGWK